MTTHHLTTIAALPSGAGSRSALPAEVAEIPTPVAAPAVAPQAEATHTEPAITMETMEEIDRCLARMKSRDAARRHGFEPFDYAERN